MIEAPSGLAARRRFRDNAATLAARGAGITVLAALLLMLAYLVYICLPLALPARLEPMIETPLDPGSRFAVREADASVWRLPPVEGVGDDVRGEILSSGNRAALALPGELHVYDLVRLVDIAGQLNAVSPDARWRLRLATPGALRSLAFDSSAGRALIAYYDGEDALHAIQMRFPTTGAVELQRWTLAAPALRRGRILLNATQDELIVVQGDRFLRWHLPASPGSRRALVFGGQLFGLASEVDTAAWGPGRETILVASASAELHRYDTARRNLPPLGTPVALPDRLHWIGSERERRLSALLTKDERLLLLVPSSAEFRLRAPLPGRPPAATVKLSADGAYIYTRDEERVLRWPLRAGSPDTGWRSLWLPQHYGAYDESTHGWHPDGAAIGVLPKYGLTPLLWGTFKAAIYGMIIAVPLALGAAIYTGYFLPPRRRNQVKPAVEMLEAFPTVVLGFLAGLWLAPVLAEHLFAVLLSLLLLVLVPLFIAALHLLLQRRGGLFLHRIPRLLLVLLAYAVAAVLLLVYAGRLEALFFAGTLQEWLWSSFGLRYDQRNALLIGLAMGLAITPVMFSIIEDAINAVPRSLSDGSLALGATRWQSLAGVVLPAASPAILSALLIGFARGLGETMIVLLATGNTPVLEVDPFSGLRSLAATVAAELPEADAGGVHFRLLFLAAFVLFALTFVLNTVAELFRQRLRYAYAGR
ncbi:MAG: ABC transporter permease subunit [Pseudomonadota bacterium]